MVAPRQGDILLVNLNPTKGSEQAVHGYKPGFTQQEAENDFCLPHQRPV